MENIVNVPSEMVKMIPLFEGDARQLPLFTKKCEYILKTFRGGEAQNMYLFHVITSRLAGAAANLVGERDNIDTWEELKNLLNQHFGDPRTEECLLLELEALTIQRGESYLDFCHRIQNLRSILIAKVSETVRDANMVAAKQQIYTHTSLNVFLYNLPEYLVRLVRLRNGLTLEDALKVVLEEQNFQTVYDFKNRNRGFRNNRYNNSYQQQQGNNQRQPSSPAPNRPQNSFNRPQYNNNNSQSNNFTQNYNQRPQNTNENFNFRSHSNYSSPNSSLQSRNTSRSNNSRSSQWQQPTFNQSAQSQHFADNAPRNMSGPYVGSGSNTDVTMRTASTRRINFTDSEIVNNETPVAGTSGEPDSVENFYIIASPTEKR